MNLKPNRHFWLTITLVFSILSCSQKSQQPYYIIEENGKQGFIDSTGKVVIKPAFDKVGNFSEDLALVSNGTSYGYINKKGKLVIPYKFTLFDGPLEMYSLRKINNKLSSAINEVSFSNGLALFADTAKQRYGFINTKGEVIIEPIFWNATKFKDGYAVVVTSVDNSNWEKTQWGLINTKGEFVIKDKYYKLSRLSDNFATATHINKKDSLSYNFASVVLNSKGQTVNTILPGQILLVDEFSKGYCRGLNGIMQSLTNAGYFIFDSTGNTLNNPKNGEVYYFEDVYINNGRFIWYKMNGKYSWAKLEKNKSIKVQDDRLYDTVMGGFDKTGIACVKYTDKHSSTGLYGYIDTLGNFMIEPRFNNAQNFRNGLAFTSLKSGDFLIIGYINKKGIFVWSKEIRKRGTEE